MPDAEGGGEEKKRKKREISAAQLQKRQPCSPDLHGDPGGGGGEWAPLEKKRKRGKKGEQVKRMSFSPRALGLPKRKSALRKKKGEKEAAPPRPSSDVEAAAPERKKKKGRGITFP